jgi:hypothetical protein
VKRIPPSASATTIFAGQYIRTFIPGGMFFFTDALLEHRREMEKCQRRDALRFPALRAMGCNP